ncbi:SurA-like protein, partial [Burkholderia multivorans]
MQRIKRWVGVAMAFSIIAVAGCSAAGSGGSPEETAGAEQSQTGQSQDGKPNTDSIPEVVAEVNGEKITKDDFVPLFETQYQQMMVQAQ